jgi:DedD protein
MRDVLKQRLIGALILIALGVVFWPLVFVDSDRQPLDRTSQVPPMPNLAQMRIETPQPLTDIGAETVETIIPLPDELPDQLPPLAEEPAAESQPEPVSGTRPQPKLDENGIPVAWVLQVISVGKKDKAEELTNELIGLGYKAYQRPFKHEGETLYRVSIGPVFDPNKLQQTRLAIDKHLHVSSIIARYLP